MKKFQVIFIDYDDDEFTYTKEYFDSKQEAEEWANEREFDYWDEAWNSAKQDYVYQQFFRYHNPEDNQVYYGYEVREVDIKESKSMKKSELKQIIKEEVDKVLNENKESKLKEKLKKALEKFKESGKVTKEALLDFLEGFLRNIDD